jgi:hypothetical protein
MRAEISRESRSTLTVSSVEVKVFRLKVYAVHCELLKPAWEEISYQGDSWA